MIADVQSLPTFNIEFNTSSNHRNAMSQLEHVCSLDIDCNPSVVRHTNIICSIGPSSDSREMIRKFILYGMNVARINLSLGSFDYFSNIIKVIREEEQKINLKPTIAIAVDIIPPTVRTGVIGENIDGDVHLQKGSSILVTLDEKLKNCCSADVLYLDTTYFPNIFSVLDIGDEILIDDSIIEIVVEEINNENTEMKCLVKQGGILQSGVRIKIPDRHNYRNLMSNMRQRIMFAVEQDADFLYVSYIRCKEDVLRVREMMTNLGSHMQIIARIETEAAVKNIVDIMNKADGVIISRHELSLEMRNEKVIIAQKQISALGLKFRKPTIVASQMLESMRDKPRPTRAEVSDVANAVLDGVDSLLLQVETSRGKYPLESLKLMHLIIREAEAGIFHERRFIEIKQIISHDIMDVLNTSSIAAVEASFKARASAIIVATATGKSAQMISSLRPTCPVLAVTGRVHIARQCHLFRSLHPVYYREGICENWGEDIDNRINYAIEWGRERRFFNSNETLIIVTGWAVGTGATNTVRVFYVPEKNTGGLTIERVSSMVYKD